MALHDNSMDFLEQVNEEYFDHLRQMKEARFRFVLRGGLALVALVVGSYFIGMSMNDVGYYFKKDDAPVNLGNLRAADFDVARLANLGTNDYVEFQNDVIVFDDLESEEFSFYYSPVTNFVVRTKRELPDKEVYRLADRIVTLSSWEAGLVAGQLAFPADLKVSFDGRGRLVTQPGIPDWATPIISYMANSSHVPVAQIRLFLDGDQPEDYQVFLFLIIGAAVLMAGTVGFWIDAVVRYAKARNRVARAERLPPAK